jgi:hypothetical protein
VKLKRVSKSHLLKEKDDINLPFSPTKGSHKKGKISETNLKTNRTSKPRSSKHYYNGEPDDTGEVKITADLIDLKKIEHVTQVFAHSGNHVRVLL